MVAVRFSNFWGGTDSVERKFFVPLLSAVYGESVTIVKDPNLAVDLEVQSVFPKRKSFGQRLIKKIGITDSVNNNLLHTNVSTNANRRIWWTGENIRPPIAEEFDAYLSFDSDSFHSKNLYLPLWVLNINWFGNSNIQGFVNRSPSQGELLTPNNSKALNLVNRNGCCAFIGRMENTRKATLFSLQKVMEIAVFGTSVGRPVIDKIAAANNFRFILCFENDLYPGYVTEKLLEAQLTNAFPLYWGPSQDEYFNPESYLNLSNFSGIEAFIDEIVRLDHNEEEMMHKLSCSPMKKGFDLNKIVSDLRELIL